eukprot:jgi/Chlat1/1316/Chrsp118S01741
MEATTSFSGLQLAASRRSSFAGAQLHAAAAPSLRRPLPTTTAPSRAPTVMMAKKVTGIVKLALEAGKATPQPPVGPALGSKGVNIMAFCKEYNAQTQDKAGLVIPVEITVYDDRSFTFVLKTPPASVLLKKAIGASAGANTGKLGNIGTITQAQLRDIATIKLPDLNCNDVEAAMRIVGGTASNMGIKVADS